MRGVILPLPRHHCLPSHAIQRQLQPAQQDIQVEENSHFPRHPQSTVLGPWLTWLYFFKIHCQASHWSYHHQYLYYFHFQIAESVLSFMVQRKHQIPGNQRNGVSDDPQFPTNYPFFQPQTCQSFFITSLSFDHNSPTLNFTTVSGWSVPCTAEEWVIIYGSKVLYIWWDGEQPRCLYRC